MSDFFIYVILTLITPGPNTIMSMSNGICYGFRKGIRFNIGSCLGISILMTACLCFSRALSSILPQARPIMAGIGFVYMMYQAYKCLIRKMSDTNNAGIATISGGFLIQFTNAKVIIFGITAMSNYIVPNISLFGIQLIFAILLALIAATCSTLWLVCGSLIGSFIRKHEKAVNIVTALMFVYCAYRLVS